MRIYILLCLTPHLRSTLSHRGVDKSEHLCYNILKQVFG